jgi:hypothetical protein
MQVLQPLAPAQIRALARQLEHYFSSTNLAKDTYLQTLRELNDGCVPVSILAGFAKVKAILGGGDSNGDQELRARAIVQVIEQQHAPRLELQLIDKHTGKRVSTTAATAASSLEDDHKRSTSTVETISTLMAVGIVSTNTNSVELHSKTTTSHTTTTTTMSGNTIILRDVPMCVTQEEVRGLLDEIEDCPPILSILPEVANCWYVSVENFLPLQCKCQLYLYPLPLIFTCRGLLHWIFYDRFITLDTADRSHLMHVMMQLRTKAYPSTGDYVMARLRASIVTSAPVDIYDPLLPPSHDVYAAASTSSLLLLQPLKKKKKKKRTRSKKKKNKRNATANAAAVENIQTAGNSPSSPLRISGDSTAAVPPLSLDHFPSLMDDKVEWATTLVDSHGTLRDTQEDDVSETNSSKDDEEEDRHKPGKAFSDAASTATTTSSTATASSTGDTVAKKTPMRGYAAAVLQVPTGSNSVHESTGTTPTMKSAMGRKVRSENNIADAPSQKHAAPPAPLVISSTTSEPSPAWDRSRSFADTVRQNCAPRIE